MQVYQTCTFRDIVIDHVLNMLPTIPSASKEVHLSIQWGWDDDPNPQVLSWSKASLPFKSREVRQTCTNKQTTKICGNTNKKSHIRTSSPNSNQTMHASGCETTKQMRLHAGMPNLQGETIRIESSTNKDDQHDGYQHNKHEIWSQNKDTQGINSGQNILPAMKSQHVQLMSYEGVTQNYSKLLQVIQPKFKKIDANANATTTGMHGSCIDV